MDVFTVDTHTHTSLPKVADMTRQTPPPPNPPYISACVQTGGQSRLPWQLLLLSTFLADVTEVHSSVERQEKGRPWRSVCLFALSFCRGLLI